MLTNVYSQLNDGNPFDGGGGLTRQRTQIVYSSTELLTMGFVGGSVFDTLYFNITSRNSIQPYNLNITYYYTNPSYCFSFTSLAPNVIAGGGIFSGMIDLSAAGNYYIPPSGGFLKIPLSPPIVWNNAPNSLVFDICWETNNGQQTDSILNIPASCNKVCRIRTTQMSATACTMMPGVPFLNNVSSVGFDLLRLSQPTPANFPSHKNNVLKIESVFYAENLLRVKLYNPNDSKFDFKIMDVTGRIVFEINDLNSVTGENTVAVNTGLIKGVYLVELCSKEGIVTTKFLCN